MSFHWRYEKRPYLKFIHTYRAKTVYTNSIEQGEIMFNKQHTNK